MKSFRYLALATLVAFAACSESSNTGDNGGGTTPVVTGTISGTVTIGGSGASGITVTLSSGSTATTDGSGAYSFTNVAAGAYTVTISDYPSDVTFSSTSKAATISTAGATVNVGFAGSYITTSSISGAITADGSGVAGVAVKASGPSGDKSAVSDANGNFSFNGLRAGTYTITISNIPSGYTFATTSATVSVGVGEAKSAPFVGSKAAANVDAQVIIKSVTTGTTNTPVNPNAVAGQIDVTLAIDPGTNSISKVCVLLNDKEIPNGCQTLSSSAPGQDAQAAATFEPVFSIPTAAFDGNTGAPLYLNGNYKLSAKLTLVGAKQSSVETSMQLTFANADVIKVTLTPAKSVVGTLAPNAGRLFYGGDQMVGLIPVLYSGKTLQTATVTFSGNGSTQTTTTFPGSVTFLATKAAGASGGLLGYQSAAINVDVFNVTSALYSDGTSAGGLVGTLATGPNGVTSNIDEVAPPIVALNLTDQTAITVAAAAAPTQLCCSNNWVGPDYAFAGGLAATPADAAGGAGYGTTTFHVGAATLTNAAIAALPAVSKASDAGLALSLVNTENSVVAVYTDLLGNQSMTRLSGAGNNALTTFGYDNTAPTGQTLAAGDLADQVIFNAGAPPATGPGPLTFSATEDRSGFSLVPLRLWMSQITAAGTTYPIGQVTAAAPITLVGPVNVGSAVPVCGAAPTNAAPCTPNKNVADGYYHVEGMMNDQAGVTFATAAKRDVLVDQTVPVQNNVNLPSQVKKNTQITVATLVTDNLDLWSTAFGFDFGSDGIFVPLADVYSFQSNRWDVSSKSDLITSGTATLTVDAVVARERANGAGGAPNAGTLASATNVRAITTDAAGNLSAAVQNNFIAGTVDAGTDYGAGATPMQSWAITKPSTAVTLCNGQGTTACATGNVKTVTVNAVATGAAGTYPFPFGASGKVWFYLNVDGGDATYYTADDTWTLLSPVVGGTSATIQDGGTPAVRTYTYTFTLTSAMVAHLSAGATPNVIAVGFNPVTGTAIFSQPQPVTITIANGT